MVDRAYMASIGSNSLWEEEEELLYIKSIGSNSPWEEEEELQYIDGKKLKLPHFFYETV